MVPFLPYTVGSITTLVSSNFFSPLYFKYQAFAAFCNRMDHRKIVNQPAICLHSDIVVFDDANLQPLKQWSVKLKERIARKEGDGVQYSAMLLSSDDDLPSTTLPEEGHVELLEPTEMTPSSDIDMPNTPAPTLEVIEEYCYPFLF